MKKWILIGVMVLIFPVTVFATPSLDQINQQVCWRFEEDINKLSGIMEELKARKGLAGQKTLVAFGTPQNEVERADYWITYTAEALAFQKAQKYSSGGDLKYSLQILANKILRAKTQVRKALNE
ncbi:hypothetical protein HY387_00305 [Candidatus Daviesbacteria bacterium]|nr:hypothetical protein [Candidatus Daviesbacteria bacterium]